jgi:vanillate O-demethylase monooxygenase subunit
MGGGLRKFWYPVAWSTEVTDKPVPVKVLGEPIVLWRADGEINAFYDLCIHRGTPLSLGWITDDGKQLVCGYHGWHYDAAGACTWIPSLPPGRSIPNKACAKVYRAEEKYGLIWVCVDEPVTGIPDFPPEMNDASYMPRPFRDGYWKCNAARFIENMMDTSHFAWVHTDIFGTREKPVVTPTTITMTEWGMEFEFLEAIGPMVEPTKPHIRSYELTLPFMILFRTRQPDRPERDISWFVCNPISSKEMRWFIFGYANYEHPLGPERRNELGKIVNEQDRTVVEAQRPEELPLDLSEELHLRGPDSVAVEYRRRLRQMGVDWE